MRDVLILNKVIEILLIESGLTIPQIQHKLKEQYNITVPKRQIIALVSLYPAILDVIRKQEQLIVSLTPAYRNLIKVNYSKN